MGHWGIGKFTRAPPLVFSRLPHLGLESFIHTDQHHLGLPPLPALFLRSVPHTWGHMEVGGWVASLCDWDLQGQDHHLLLNSSWGVPDLWARYTTIVLPTAFGQEPRWHPGLGCQWGFGNGVGGSTPSPLLHLLLLAGNPDDLQCSQRAGSAVKAQGEARGGVKRLGYRGFLGERSQNGDMLCRLKGQKLYSDWLKHSLFAPVCWTDVYGSASDTA